AAVFAVFVEEMAHDTHAFGGIDEVRFETDQAAHGNEGFHGDLVADVVHVDDLRLAGGEIFHDGAEIFAGHFDEQFFNRFERIAGGILFPQHFRARDEDFVTFAAHLFDENGNLHFAAAADGKDFRVGRLCDTQRDVRAGLFHEPIPDMTGGDEFAVLAGERAVIDGEFHLDRGRINRDVRQRG